jgi:predicted RNase H-like nuclease (RuvC/YqgF family)
MYCIMYSIDHNMNFNPMYLEGIHVGGRKVENKYAHHGKYLIEEVKRLQKENELLKEERDDWKAECEETTKAHADSERTSRTNKNLVFEYAEKIDHLRMKLKEQTERCEKQAEEIKQLRAKQCVPGDKTCTTPSRSQRRRWRKKEKKPPA